MKGTVLVELLAAIASLLLLAASFVVRPERVTFRAGWLNGVRPDGWYELRRQPRFSDDETPPGAVRSRVYCTGGARAIAVDYRTVGCQR